jgi:hypothetical protein
MADETRGRTMNQNALTAPAMPPDRYGRQLRVLPTHDGLAFLEGLQAVIATGAGVVVPLQHFERDAMTRREREAGRFLGWYDGGGAYIMTMPALALVRAAQTTPAAAWLTPWTLNKQLAALGVLATMGSTTITVKKRVAGNSYSTLHLRPGVLDVGHYAETWESWVSGDSTRG